MALQFSRSNYYLDIQRDAAGVQNIARIANRAVREVLGDVDIRSTKRKAYLSPYIGKELYDYQAPADLKDWAIVDVARIAGRKSSDKFDVVASEYFDRLKTYNKNLIAIQEGNLLTKLRISADLRGDDHQAVIDDMDATNDSGTWSVSLDATSLSVDKDMFVHGDASLKFSMDQSATTVAAGYLVNSTLDSVDLTDYDNGFVFVSVYAPTITNLDSITLRIGNSASVYLEQAVTVTNENLAFHTGWMLLRFDIASMTETGSVDLSAIDYVRLALDRNTGTIAATDWRFDYIVARRGIPHEVWYYTRYGWQTSAGVYLENSTADTDLIICDQEEYQLYVWKGKELVAEDLKFFDEADRYRKRYQDAVANYVQNNPSERLLVRHSYRHFSTEPINTWLD